MLIRPTTMPLSNLMARCQRQSIIGDHSIYEHVRGTFERGLGIRSGLRNWLRRPKGKPIGQLGEPSRFAEGEVVRVRDDTHIRATLDRRARLRGLEFVSEQWATCGKLYRVEKVVRRILDDRGLMRPVSRTVLLTGVDCGGESGEGGCGRLCPLLYRDDWLESGDPDALIGKAPPMVPGVMATIRPLKEIVAGLDLLGRRDGLLFMPIMSQYAGKRVRVLKALGAVYEFGRWVPTRSPIYILEDLWCTGAVLGTRGPCDRRCRLLWHSEWIAIENTNECGP